MQNFIVTGTDTDAGKTYVSCLIIKALREKGIDIAGFKPVACGSREDPRQLRAASGLEALTLERIYPVYLKNATSPCVAARLENTEIDFDLVHEAYERLSAEHDCVLVEGVGGWEVPMAPGVNFSDYARELHLPVLLVVNNKLGVLNHAVLTVNAMKAQGIRCAGIIFNNVQEEWDTASITNRAMLEEMVDVPVLEELIHGQDYLDADAILGGICGMEKA